MAEINEKLAGNRYYQIRKIEKDMSRRDASQKNGWLSHRKND